MIAYTKTKLTQQERTETDLKQRIYGQNGDLGTYSWLNVDVKG